MAKTVLITDADAFEQGRETSLEDRSYVDVNGVKVGGTEVVRSIHEGYNDTSKLKEPEAAQAQSDGATVQGGAMDLVNRFGSSFIEYKLIRKLLGSGGIIKNGLAALAVTFGKKLNILPTSVSPILGAAGSLVGSVLGPEASGIVEKVAEFVPEPNTKDTSIVTGVLTGTMGVGEGVAGFLWDKLGSEDGPVYGRVTEGSDFLERDESDRTLASAEDRVRAIYKNVFGEEAPDIRTADPKKTKEYMEANGKLMAEDGVFASCAEKDDTDREFAGMRAMTSASCELLEAAAGKAFSSGKLAKGYMNMAEGLAAYEAGAMEGFGTAYPDGADKAMEGLDKVMSASRGPLVESIVKMQEERGLFSDEELERLRDLIPELGPAMSVDMGGYDYMPDDEILNAHKAWEVPVEEPAQEEEASASVPAASGRQLPDMPSEDGKQADDPGYTI